MATADSYSSIYSNVTSALNSAITTNATWTAPNSYQIWNGSAATTSPVYEWKAVYGTLYVDDVMEPTPKRKLSLDEVLDIEIKKLKGLS